MTYLDLVKKHIPDANDAYADYILWEKTSFPIVRNPEILEEQIMNFAKKVQK